MWTSIVLFSSIVSSFWVEISLFFLSSFFPLPLSVPPVGGGGLCSVFESSCWSIAVWRETERAIGGGLDGTVVSCLGGEGAAPNGIEHPSPLSPPCLTPLLSCLLGHCPFPFTYVSQFYSVLSLQERWACQSCLSLSLCGPLVLRCFFPRGGRLVAPEQLLDSHWRRGPQVPRVTGLFVWRGKER